ncbi:hypothetical protein [Extibacter muris]|nr:hypothetical protein [Extibacter muris]MCQ4662460.1 hypothetical protein [Extibacter muris]MCQ4691613.1 hypothetical protein [Extibacter muris]
MVQKDIFTEIQAKIGCDRRTELPTTNVKSGRKSKNCRLLPIR